MKKTVFFVCMMVMLFTSCSTSRLLKTASTLDTKSTITSLTIADLDVHPERVSRTIVPSEDVIRGGEDNVRRAAEAEILAEFNNADVLVDAQYIITKNNGSLFKKPKITSITISGHPAHYKDFRSVSPTVWENAIASTATVGNGNMEQDHGETNQSILSNHIPRPHLNFSNARFEGYINAQGGYFFTDAPREDNNFFAGGSITLGCRINPWLFIGVGAAGKYMFDSDLVYVPVYGDIRFYTHKGGISPFIDTKVGYSFVPDGKSHEGGFYVSPTIGYAFGRFEIGVQYTYQKGKVERYYENSFGDHHVGLSLGLRL